MTNKMFYIPGYNALVYCHTDATGILILSGLNHSVQDAREDYSRQSIEKPAFKNLNPIEIVDELLSTYDFLHEPTPGIFQVRDYKQKWYLEEASALPSAPFKRQDNYKESLPSKKNSQIGLDF